MANDTRHRAQFLASLFLMSKYSLKYDITPNAICILRYICDCLDIGHYQSVKLSQRQIAIYTRSHQETVLFQLRRLAKLRIIKIHKSDKKRSSSSYSVGALLIAFANQSERIKKKSERNGDKKRRNLNGMDGISYNKASYNLSNTNFSNFKNQKPVDNSSGYASVESQSNSYVRSENIQRAPMPENLRSFIKQIGKKPP